MASEPPFETFDTYDLTDQEFADTERLVNLIREAQCLYTLGGTHEDDAEQLCDELLADDLLPAGLRLKVLVLKMSIEQDIDKIEKLVRETENLYSVVIRYHPKGHNAAADEILEEVREALDITISFYERQAEARANVLAADLESRMSGQELEQKRIQEKDEAEDDEEWEKEGAEEEEEEEDKEEDKEEEEGKGLRSKEDEVFRSEELGSEAVGGEEFRSEEIRSKAVSGEGFRSKAAVPSSKVIRG